MELGIKGHETRGKEVIELLKMLGGRIDVEDLPFDNDNFVFYIGYNKCVYPSTVSSFKGVIYSLEEFEDKFPFKVGDFVDTPEYESEVRINTMKWDVYSEEVLYMVYYVDEEEWYTAEELLDYNDIEDYKNIKSNKEETITIDDFKANTKEWLIDKLESMSKDNALQAICNIYDELHKPKYPKSYEECCMILQDACMTHRGGYKGDLIQTFQKLLICRNTYWKIAGEEMGLGKPWEPDWNELKQKYTIVVIENKLIKHYALTQNYILVFPTEEMRDAFFENFKDLIESCKELL